MNAFLITCEHGGNRVPPGYARLFGRQLRALASHRAYDRDALPLARRLARRLEAPLAFSTVTRLLVDLNRSVTNRAVFSEFTAGLDRSARGALLDRHYHPYRRRVEALVAEAIGRAGRAIHLSVHTFGPVLNGEVRSADVGLLYDPSRHGEQQLCAAWRAELQALRPELKTRRNYPYRGTADGLTTHLRRQFPAHQYLGIELEVNARWPAGGATRWQELQYDLARTLLSATRARQQNRPRRTSPND